MKVKCQKINEDNLPIKYRLKVYNLDENYPTLDDLLFELASNPELLDGVAFDHVDVRFYINIKMKRSKRKTCLEQLYNNGYLGQNKDEKYFLQKHKWI